MECYTGKWFEARGISYMFSVIIRVTNNSVSQDYPHPDDHVKHIIHQSIWTPGVEGTFTQCECECQWSSWTPGQKHWVKSPPLGTQLYKPKSRMCRIGSDSHFKNIQMSKGRQHGHELHRHINVKCSNYQVAWKFGRWQIKCESPAYPDILGEEVKASVHPTSWGNTRIWGDYPRYAQVAVVRGGGFK